MRRITYIILLKLVFFVSTINAQEGKTIIKDDNIKIKKVNILESKRDTIVLTNHNSKSSSTTASTGAKNSGIGIGETLGNLSVSLTGGALYEIPIVVPPGINDIEPEISLVYNSQSGDGLAGYGWNIKGVSTISRIPSSKYHDNNIDCVDFDSQDRFSLDGQRLILKSGTYGGNGAVYETENYSNIKVTSHGISPYGSTFGPAFFIVYYPDGSIARYGDSSDSRSHTNYSITFWQNPQGVKIAYEYIISNNSQAIKKIKYGSLYNNTPVNDIIFNYFGGPRMSQSYVNGINIVGDKRLSSIECFSNGVRYRRYSLDNSGSNTTTLEYNRLTNVTEYSGDNTESHSSINFSYNDTSSSVIKNDITTDLDLINLEQRNAHSLSLDMTGNGKMDFIVYPDDKDKFWTFHNLQEGVTNPSFLYDIGDFETIFPTNILSQQNKILSGQGLTIVQKGPDNEVNFEVYGKSAAGTLEPLTYNYTKLWNSPTYPSFGTLTPYDIEYVSGDFNGDGLTDALAIGKPYSSVNTYRSVFFINLRRDISTGFASYTGQLELKLFGDYKLKTGDFNGDGKTDLFHAINGKVYIYTLDNNNNLSLLWETTDSEIKSNDPFMMGDYNGDGKTDFMTPLNNNSDEFNTYLSKGEEFIKGTHAMPFTYKKTNWDGDDGVLYGYNLLPLDVNGDGKTDIVEYNTVTYNDPVYPWDPPAQDGTQTVKIYNNLRIISNSIPNPTRIKFQNGGSVTKTGDVKHFPIPIYLSSNQQNKNLDFASISNQWVTNFSFTHDHREDVLLRSIENNGMTYELDYSYIDPSVKNESYDAPVYLENLKQVYQSDINQIYPNIDLGTALGTQVVNTIRRYGDLSTGTVMSKKVFSYKGAVYNAEGLGFLGFSAMSRSNWHTDIDDRIFTITKHDPTLRGVMVEQYSMPEYHNFNTPTSNYIDKTSYQYSSSLSSTKVFKLWMDSSFNQNYLEGTFTNTTYQYDTYNNPENIQTNFMGGSKTQQITYTNSTGSNYYIGRPTNVITTSNIEGESFSTEQAFIYSGDLLTTIKTKGDGTPFNSESYEYDTFGNVTKIITTPDSESSREVEFEYDVTGRFITKSIDIEDLETTYIYDPDYGNWNVSGIVNPYGQTTNYEYDAWDRIVKITDYLGKKTITDYSETNNAYTISTTGEDGSGMIVEYDQLQRVSVIKEKDVLGNWNSVKYEYDALDRLVRQSEPYSGGAPTQWNETVYDLYSRPISQILHTGRTINIGYNYLTTVVDDGVKTVTSTRNQLGNIISVTDPGGTINYTYYGNGNLKTANNNGVTIFAEQDGWGRQTKLVDPSAGTYEYTYDGYGQLTEEETPKGRTEFFYSLTGQLTRKIIQGDNTQMDIKYYYNASDKLLSSVNMVNTNGSDANYNYTYDNYKRLVEVQERNEYADFLINYTYDTFGRVLTEEYTANLFLNGKSSNKKIINKYGNGLLQAILDFSTERTIWEVDGLNARGQITRAKMGNGMEVVNDYNAHGYLTESIVNKNINSSPNQIMRLKTNFNIERGTLNDRFNSLFSWSETFEYDNLDRLITFDDNDGDNYHQYDDMGRITFNNTVGDYNYTGASYQVDTIDLNTQGDAYYQQNPLQQVTYNAFKKPANISELGKEKIDFQYNAFMGRAHMFYGNESEDIREREKIKHYSHDGSMEITYDFKNDVTLFVTYIGGDAYTAPAVWRSEEGEEVEDNGYYYLHRDYLGSIMLITDQEGNAKEKRHFDAWGNLIKVADGEGQLLDKLTFLDRGYTGHEHLSGVGLIHMNGRLYDPKLKRFLSPDNHIQNPYSTQNFNRYSYVLNNPLMYVDPSGETGEDPPGWQQSLLGSALYSVGSSINWEGIRMRDVSDWMTKHIFRPIQDFGDWVGGWFKGKSTDKTFSNYEGLSNDPLAGSSASTEQSFFNAGGTESSLGIKFNPDAIAEMNNHIFPTIKPAPTGNDYGPWNYRWANSESFIGQLSYGVANDAFQVLQTFDFDLIPSGGENPLTGGRSFLNIDGTPNYKPIEGFVNTFTSLLPTARGVTGLKSTMPKGLGYIKKWHASKFSRIFKGTFLTKQSHKIRGRFNRYFNKGIDYINNTISNGMFLLYSLKFKKEE